MKTPDMIEYKVLPFETNQGKVPGHAFMVRGDIESFVFERWDTVSDMMVKVLLHPSRVTAYMKKSWPNGGRCHYVILRDGSKIHTNSWSVRHQSDAGYMAAPILCRNVYRITTLGNGHRLAYVEGVDQWAWSKRRPEDEALILNPWERDNKLFQEEMERREAEYAAKVAS